MGGDVERVQRMRWGGFFGKEVAHAMDQSYERSPRIGGTCAIVFCSSCTLRGSCTSSHCLSSKQELQKEMQHAYVFAFNVTAFHGSALKGVRMALARLGMPPAVTSSIDAITITTPAPVARSF